MLLFSIIWAFLAVTVTLAAMKSRVRATQVERVDVPEKKSGRATAWVASIYGLILLVGFFYITKFLVSTL